MARLLKIAGHLPVDELERRYRTARDAVARSQWQIVWPLAQGRRIRAVEAQTGYADRWIREIAARSNAQGADGLGDRRHSTAGKPRLLSEAQEETVRGLLEGLARDGGVWSGPKVAIWMGTQLGRKVHPTRGWELVRRLASRLGRPRPRQVQASAEAQEACKGGDLPSR